MRPTTDPDAAFAALRAADPDVLDRDELADLVRRLGEVRGWCDALEVRVSRRTRALEADGRAERPESLLTDGGRASGKDAKTAGEREEICGAMPSFEDALAAGAVSSGHIDALANATRNLDDEVRAEFVASEADLLADAERQRVEAFERSCRDLAKTLATQSRAKSDAAELDEQRKRSNVRRWVDKATGMHHTHLELDPVRDARLWAAIDAQRAVVKQQDGNRRRPWMQVQVDAVVTAAGGAPAAARVPEVTVLIDHRSLLHGLHERGVCETAAGVPLPVSTVRRLCCEADMVPVVLNGDGEALDAGRSVRTATAASSTPGHAPNLRPPRLHGDVRRVSDPPRDPMAARRRE